MDHGRLRFLEASERHQIQVQHARRITLQHPPTDPVTGVGMARLHWFRHYPIAGDPITLIVRRSKRG